MRSIRAILCVLLCVVAYAPALAVNPDEILPDPALEQRARDISANLRCLVCQNQSIDDSDAQLARDLRVLVRERLVAGETNEQIMDYVVGRYGEFVLLRPSLSMKNLVLWGTPVLVLLIGGFAAYSYSRRHSAPEGVMTLSVDEEARLNKLLDEQDNTKQ